MCSYVSTVGTTAVQTIGNKVTGELADTPTCRQDDSRTGQLADVVVVPSGRGLAYSGPIR